MPVHAVDGLSRGIEKELELLFRLHGLHGLLLQFTVRPLKLDRPFLHAFLQVDEQGGDGVGHVVE